MVHVQAGGPTTDRPSASAPLRAIADRLQGPGGFYNAGNLLGLGVSLGTQFVVAATTASDSFADQLYVYFAGSPQAVALTVATTIFLASGESYHRAWAGRATPSKRLNRIADLLSAAGATALTISLLFTGEVVLAIASGMLIVGGKLGSALTCDDRSRVPLWPRRWTDPFRTAVLLGRGPGLAAAIFDFARHGLDPAVGAGPVSLIPSATLIVCYALWIRADLMLLGSASRVTMPVAGATGGGRP